jgi:large subunit ribosomal protein L30
MATTKSASGKLRVTQVRSSIRRTARHKACLTGLGLRRREHSVVVADTPENRGMINKVAYMLSVEEA